jgi:hypothetical protein
METVNIYDLKITNNNFNDVYKELVDFAQNNKFKDTYLLNMPNVLNNENKNYIENFVFDTALFQLSEYNKKNNTSIDIKNIFIEFWSLQDTHFKRMHFDKDEQDYLINKNNTTYRKPFLSCITYLNDDVYAPTLITDIRRITGSNDEREDFYSGKHTNFGFVYPKKMKQITFDGGNYLHGMYLFDEKCSNRLVLPINFWFERPTYLSYFPYYSYLKSTYSNHQIISLSKKHMNIEYQTPLLYFNKTNIDTVMKTIDIIVDKDNIDGFNNWYRHLILGDTAVELSFLKDFISTNDYIYYFKFTFIFD